MKVLSSFKESLVLLWKNPSIIIFVLIINLVAFPESINLFRFTLFSMERAGRLLSGLFILITSPYLVGGILAMVKEASEGKTASIETFKHSGKTHYFDIVLSNLVLLLFMVISVSLSSLILWIASKVGAGIQYDLDLIVSLNTILGLIGFFFVQFFDTGIVIGGYSGLETIKQSIRFVWRRIPGVLVYDFLLILIFILVDIPEILFAFSDRYPIVPASAGLVILYICTTLILSTLALSIFFSFRGVYYIRARVTDTK